MPYRLNWLSGNLEVETYTAAVVGKHYVPPQTHIETVWETDSKGHITAHVEVYTDPEDYVLDCREDHAEYDHYFGESVWYSHYVSTNVGDKVTLHRLAWVHRNDHIMKAVEK